MRSLFQQECPQQTLFDQEFDRQKLARSKLGTVRNIAEISPILYPQ
jgi:hypothetical protein